MIEVDEDLGKSYLFPPITIKKDLCLVRPATNNKGIIRENGQTDAFTSNSMFFQKSYAQFLKAPQQSNLAIMGNESSNKLGAKTPEELPKLLLKCLKTNDKVTWMRCMQPDDSVEKDYISAQKFDRHREALTARGVTNWGFIQYSRLMYPLRQMGGSKVDPNKMIPFSTVEFTYQNNECVGSLRMGICALYEGKWLM